jgi:hypothetical protein
MSKIYVILIVCRIDDYHTATNVMPTAYLTLNRALQEMTILNNRDDRYDGSSFTEYIVTALELKE